MRMMPFTMRLRRQGKVSNAEAIAGYVCFVGDLPKVRASPDHLPPL